MIYDRRPDYCDLQLKIERKETVDIFKSMKTESPLRQL